MKKHLDIMQKCTGSSNLAELLIVVIYFFVALLSGKTSDF